MVISLNFKSSTPIYIQLRNQILVGISTGELAPGEKLPTVRALAEECGINTMTVNKTYQLLRQEGYIDTDRRNGAMVRQDFTRREGIPEEEAQMLKLLGSEAKLGGMSKAGFLKACEKIWEELAWQ